MNRISDIDLEELIRIVEHEPTQLNRAPVQVKLEAALNELNQRRREDAKIAAKWLSALSKAPKP